MSLKRLLVLVLAIGQIFSSYFGGFNGEDAFSTPIVTPAGYAFSIWGVITLGCVVYGVYQLLPRQQKNKLYDELSLPLIITFTGFSVWIYAATRNWLWATVVIFIIMLLSLWWAYTYLLKEKKKFTRFENILFHGVLGLYIGWATVATVINVASALTYYNYIYSDTRSLGIYILILLIALANALFGLKKIHFNAYYFITILWAFVAVAVRTFDRDSMILTFISLGAVGLVTWIWLKNKSRFGNA